MELYKFEDMTLKESTEEMLKKILDVGFTTMIVAMKGDSYTGKTTCADAIAKEFRCSVISLDSIMDSLSQMPTSSPKEAKDRLADLAFDVLIRVVRLQLKVGRPVVVDSPLTKPGHLDQLLAMVEENQSCGNPECDKLHCRLVIVECRPQDKWAWKQRFERHDRQQTDKQWYKPKEWKDVVHSESANDYSPGRLPNFVSILFVDTTSYLEESNLGPAALDLCMCPKGHLLDFHDWLPHKPYHTGFNPTYSVGKFSGRNPPLSEDEDQEPVAMKWPIVVIAMKGDAGTGKTTCAKAIAKSYGSTLLTFDDILDSLSPSPPSSPEEEDRLFDLAFDIIRRLVKVQMSMRQPVVIDSPLGRPSHLQQLLRLRNEFKYSPASGSYDSTFNSIRLIVVECQPKAEYVWQQTFKKHSLTTSSKWYKPKEWDQVTRSKSVDQYFADDRLPDSLCALVVDTTSYVYFERLGPATFDLCFSPQGGQYYFEIWQDNNPNDSPLFSDFLGRVNSHPQTEQGDTINNDLGCAKDGRHLLQESGKDDMQDDEVVASLGCMSCRACQEHISDPADPGYACRRCKLTIHKSCVELQGKTIVHDPHSNLPRFLQIISLPLSNPAYSYRFQGYNKIRCSDCLDNNREFSVDCVSCLWEVHLRSRQVPTLIRHEGYSLDLPICFWITSSVNPREYRCAACKLAGCLVGYTCLKRGTFVVNFHVECVLLPRVVEHVHGQHHHQMQLTFIDETVSDDYLCDVCLKLRDPTAWHYFCKQCCFYSHLHCIYMPCD